MASGAVGCALDDPRNRAIVLLDREAAASGARVHQELSDPQSGVLPILVQPDLATDVENGARSVGRVLRVGELLWVRGRELSTTTLDLGLDVERDRFELHAEPDAAREMAQMLSAQLRELGHGRHELQLVNAFTHSAFAARDGVHEVLPVELDAALVPSDAAPVLSLDAPLAAAPALRPTALQALASAPDPVGVYRSDDGRLLLDASGRFRACLPELRASRGTYRLQGRTLVLEAAGEALWLQRGDAGRLTHDSGLVLARNAGDMP